ncbi:DUF4395 domain-containing protein [Sulfurimonas sp.]|uniref:DUF4395 domain-containing protein n=1 Tax=Sulfurimonas sp. TaxID=2022749 RepID=UPI0025EC6E6C|nr:DUF4395 domain-containing protein [Sulfurimonas sp.]MCK9472530.1 DUF4395 domain-containing protein [Sulfurimonas sp.]MDD3505120.1 DUF4395 domain-containing protein [Sulfurimonas sp.]
MKSCPITYKIVDQNIIRIVASEVSALGIFFIIYPNFAILALLLYDFFVRMLGYEKVSPLYNLARVISKLFGVKKDKIDAGPKEFALKIGFLFALLSVAIFLLNQMFATVAVIAMLTACALLEALFNYCIGCKIYMLLKKLKLF